MGEKKVTMKMILIVVLTAFLASEFAVVMVNGRYLPTRSQDDKIERLRELLKDLLESQNMNTRQQQDLNYDQGELVSVPSSQIGGLSGGGIGSSGRTLLFKRDIQQGNSGSYLLNPSQSQVMSSGQRPFDEKASRRN